MLERYGAVQSIYLIILLFLLSCPPISFTHSFSFFFYIVNYIASPEDKSHDGFVFMYTCKFIDEFKTRNVEVHKVCIIIMSKIVHANPM